MGARLYHTVCRASSTRPSALASARLSALALLTTVAFAAFSPVRARAEEPAAPAERRIAWAGVVGGALSPAETRALEIVLIEALGNDVHVVLVDVGGRPLGQAARVREVARVKRMLREGIDQVLRGRHEEGRGRIDQAVALFESTLGTHDDHDVLHDALLAQSESLFERGQTEAARTTLERLHALSPRLAPTEPRGLVAIWKKVLEAKLRTSRLEIDAPEGATLFVDGRPMGPPPLLLPTAALGHHLIGVAWPDLTVSQAVQVTAGRPVRVRIERPELADRARLELAEAVSTRLGPATVTGAIPRVATMSGATEVLLAAVRPEGAVYLVRHGSDGMLRRVVGGTLAGNTLAGPQATALAEAVLPDRPLGGFRLSANGDLVSWVAAASEAYGGPAPAPPVALAGLREGPREAWSDAPLVTEDEPSIVGRPWFWVLVGGLAAGLVVGGVLLAQPAPETTVFRVVLPSTGALHAEDR